MSSWQGGFRNPIIHGNQIIEGTVGSGALEDGAVITSKLADLAVEAGKLQDEAVENAKLGDGAVTTVKLQDLAVTTAKIGLLAVGSAQIANLAVTNAKIDTLSASKLTTGTINTGTISVSSELRFGTSGRIQFTRGSTAVISTNHNPQSGDIWIEYRGNDAGALIGLRKSGSTELVAAQLEVTSTGFEVTQGHFDFVTPTLNSTLGQNWNFQIAGSTHLAIQSITNGTRFDFVQAADTYIDATRSGTTDQMTLHANDHVIVDANNAIQLNAAGGGVTINRNNGSGNRILLLNIERSWEFVQRSTGATTDLMLRSTTNKGLYISDTSNGDMAILHYGRIEFPGRATTTNSGLAAWRNDGFPGDELLALSSTKALKDGIRDLTPQKARHYLRMYRPREWKGKASRDPKGVWLPGFVFEEMPKVPRDLTPALATLVAEHEKTIKDLEQRLAKMERTAKVGGR